MLSKEMLEKDYEDSMNQLILKRDEWSKKILFGDYDPKKDFIIKCMLDLANMCIDANQTKIPNIYDQCFECERVVNIKKVLPIEELRKTHPEIIVFEGVYIKVKGIAMTYDYLEDHNCFPKKALKYEFLPDGFNYGTLKDCCGKYMFAISKDDYISKYIYSSNGYNVFDVNLNY